MAGHALMIEKLKLAFDRSVRHVDSDGRLHVAISNISKANICGYYGREIPGWKALGLNADRVYQMFRDPVELERSASTFNNIPLLSRHVPVTVDDHQPDLVVGSTGTDAKFVSPFLRNSLVVWEAVAIAGIESKEQCELSCAYRYDPDMTPGVYDGTPYDGVMRNIRGNHVALVEIGRAGPDVVVSDENPFLKETIMTKEKRAEARAAAVKIAEDAGLKPEELAKLLAQDEEDPKSPEGGAKKPAEDSDEDDEEEKKKKVAEDDDDEDDKDKKDDKAMDAAISAARKEAAAEAVKRVQAIHRAEKEVHPLIGEVVAQDSAEAVYKIALDAAGVDLTGVDPSAYGAMVRLLSKGKDKPAVAQDSSAASDFWKQFPDAKLPKRI